MKVYLVLTNWGDTDSIWSTHELAEARKNRLLEQGGDLHIWDDDGAWVCPVNVDPEEAM